MLAAPQYSEAAWCLVPIAMSVYFYFAYTLIVDVEIYYGANHYIAIASMMATVINIVLNLVFIPICGYIAAGYTTLFSYFVTMIFHFIFLSNVMKKAGVRFAIFDMKVLVSASVALVICSFVGMLLYEHVLLRISIILVAAICVFAKKESIITGLKEIKQ